MSIKTRLPQIKKQVKLISGYCTNYKYQKTISMRSLSDQAKNYHSKLTATGKGSVNGIDYVTVECECHQITGDGPGNICTGSTKTLCRHCAAAFVWSNEQRGREVKLFDTLFDTLMNLAKGDKLTKIMSNGHETWAIVIENKAPGDGGLKAGDFDGELPTEYQRMLKQEMARRERVNGRILADGSFQSDRERQITNMKAYYRVARG